MTKIILAFSAEMQAAINEGRKCCTSRTHPHGQVGDTFSVSHQLFRITHIVEMYASAVAEELYGCEGFSNQNGFVDWWKEHKGSFDPDQTLHVHFFAAVLLPIPTGGFIPAVKA